MTQAHETLDFAHEQLGLPDEQLAINALTRVIGATEAELASANRSLSFNRGYVPTAAPGPRPHPEDGGMDHQDWEVANYEYTHHDEIQEEEIDRLENEIYDAEYRLDDLFGKKSSVENGDEEVIGSVAAQERARLQEVIKRAARAEERKTGKEYEGSKELYEDLLILTSDPEKLRAATEKTGPNGWQRANYRPSWTQQGSVFRVNPGEGPLKSFGSYTKGLEIAASEDSISLHYTEMHENAKAVWNGDWRSVTVDYYTLTVNRDGVVTNQAHRRGKASQQHYIGSQYSQIYQPIHNYDGVSELDFSSDDISKFRDIVAQVNADVESVQA